MSLGHETCSGMQGPCDFFTLCEVQQQVAGYDAASEASMGLWLPTLWSHEETSL